MAKVRWVKCKGCGGNVVLYLEDSPPYYAKGAVGHGKPLELVGIKGQVPCELFNQLSTEKFFKLHENAELGAEPLVFHPIVEGPCKS